MGRAISEKISEGVVTRKEIIIVSKLWGIHHDQVERACRDTCTRLNVDYIDLYLFHFPVSFRYTSDDKKWPSQLSDCLDKDYMNVWWQMEKLVDAGLVRHIGVSNFNAQQIRRVFDCCEKIKPACIEMEFHPAFCADELVNLCRDFGVNVLGYCPLGRPKAEHQQQPTFLCDKEVSAIAKKYHKSTAQIALRYTIQCGLIPIPKSATKSRIHENINVFDFQLSDDEMKFMKSFHNDDNQICKFEFARGNVHYPF